MPEKREETGAPQRESAPRKADFVVLVGTVAGAKVGEGLAREDLGRTEAEQGKAIEKLTALGRIGLPGEIPAPRARPSNRPEGDALTAEIAAKIGQLDPKADFTAQGKPIVDALNEALGYQISEAERDAGFAAYEAARKK